MDAQRPVELVVVWRDEAKLVRRRGEDGRARCMESMADDLERVLALEPQVELTLEEAAEECGYSKRSLHRLVAEGALPLVGGEGPRRVRRGDLPRKPGRVAASGPSIQLVGASPSQIAESLLKEH